MTHPPLAADGQPNRLAGSTSPYLLQHAHNPVDWWPWCPEALALARETDRPILLSIGYSACHWCHVMAHESFEDPATAAVMNRLFVNIKVDREERPDLDKVYQSAHQLLAQRAGGWPLTVFLMPGDLRPFFAGTYFPREPRHGLPAFTHLLEQVERAYREQRGAIEEQNAGPDARPWPSWSRAPGPSPTRPRWRARGASSPGASTPSTAASAGRPSSPTRPTWSSCCATGPPPPRRGSRTRQALHMATFTLGRMIRGGLNDQLGGGFCRYSVDDLWMIPHFEKMLYDNGPLLALCCDAWAATGDPLFRDAAVATADWVIREMQSPEGGYWSTLDADSEGHEGRFYAWERDAGPRPADARRSTPAFAACYGLDRPANFEGAWHLHGYRTPGGGCRRPGAAGGAGREPRSRAPAPSSSRRGERRVHPGLDDKVLTAWNALMIKGMARAARVLDRPDYLASAERALGFIRGTLWRDGRLLATYRAGKAHLDAYLDDYAYLLDALLELLQTRWRRDDLDFALALAEVLLEQTSPTRRTAASISPPAGTRT